MSITRISIFYILIPKHQYELVRLVSLFLVIQAFLSFPLSLETHLHVSENTHHFLALYVDDVLSFPEIPEKAGFILKKSANPQGEFKQNVRYLPVKAL